MADPVAFPDVDEDTIIEHIEALSEGGLLDALLVPSGRGVRRIELARVRRPTFAGHEFLSNAKNEQVWTKMAARDRRRTLSLLRKSRMCVARRSSKRVTEYKTAPSAVERRWGSNGERVRCRVALDLPRSYPLNA